jgi:hypothetical protein
MSSETYAHWPVDFDPENRMRNIGIIHITATCTQELQCFMSLVLVIAAGHNVILWSKGHGKPSKMFYVVSGKFAKSPKKPKVHLPRAPKQRRYQDGTQFR